MVVRPIARHVIAHAHCSQGSMSTSPETKSLAIFVDADACPVKDEVYRVARRYDLKVYVIANGSIRVPPDPMIELVVVEQGSARAAGRVEYFKE